jgi:hypothetical protein
MTRLYWQPLRDVITVVMALNATPRGHSPRAPLRRRADAQSFAEHGSVEPA